MISSCQRVANARFMSQMPRNFSRLRDGSSRIPNCLKQRALWIVTGHGAVPAIKTRSFNDLERPAIALKNKQCT